MSTKQTHTIPCPTAQCKSSRQCHRMSTGQCPTEACTTKHMFKEIGLKGSAANANGQCPLHKARRNKLFSSLSPDNDPLSCSPMASSHVKLHAHAQPQNHRIPLNISMPLKKSVLIARACSFPKPMSCIMALKIARMTSLWLSLCFSLTVTTVLQSPSESFSWM